jgi:hypothetical protein
MATVLNDFANGVLYKTAVAPGSYTADATGSAQDLAAADGGAFAVLAVGTLAAGTTVGGYLEESADASSWAAVPGAEFTSVTTANSVRAVTFRRTARYVRAAVTVAGGSPSAALVVIVGQGKKLI